MVAIKVQIERFVDEAQPGWVECSLVDALGEEHRFIEKVPIVTSEQLDSTSRYPNVGEIACIVVGKRELDDGQTVFEVDTDAPWGVESTGKRTRFEVAPAQLVEVASGESAG